LSDPPRLSDELRRSHLEVGVVGRAHGIRGEVKIRLHNPTSDALTQVKSVLLVTPSGPIPRELERVRRTPSGPIVQLEGVASREETESLRGAKVLVARAELPALEPGDYYLVDLIGCTVLLGGEVFGRAIAVRPDPTVDTLVIERTSGGTVEQPILDPWIQRVDVDRAIVELASDDGLIV
jgi:16S rRNA processing protein RimM